MLKFLLPVAVGLAAISGTSFAQDVGPSIKVSYRDLDLRTAEDVGKFDHRIAKAIKSLCGAGSAVMDERRIEMNRCIKETHAELAVQRNRIVARAGADRMAFSRR